VNASRYAIFNLLNLPLVQDALNFGEILYSQVAGTTLHHYPRLSFDLAFQVAPSGVRFWNPHLSRILHLPPHSPIIRPPGSVDPPYLFASQSMVYATDDTTATQHPLMSLYSWVTGPSALTPSLCVDISHLVQSLVCRFPFEHPSNLRSVNKRRKITLNQMRLHLIPFLPRQV